MFGLTIALVPSSSTTLTPSTMTFLALFGMPLIVMAPIDVHVEKSRLRFVSWTPGTTVSRPNRSRPFIWMFVSCSAVTVAMRVLVAVCTTAVSAVTVTDSESWPSFS